MAMLSSPGALGFSRFKRSMIQGDHLSMAEVLDSRIISDVSLCAQTCGRVVAQNAGNFCRARAKIPIGVIREITRRLASHAERLDSEFNNLASPLELDQAEARISPLVVAQIRRQPIRGRVILVDGFTIDAPDTPENHCTRAVG